MNVMAHEHDGDVEETTILDDTERLLAKEVDRLHKAVAISSVKEALQQRVFPMFIQVVEAMKDLEARLTYELHGDDDENGALDDVDDRLTDIEDRLALMATGLEIRVRLTALARSVKTYAEDHPNLVAEADDALEFLNGIDQQVKDALEAAREAEATEAEPPAQPKVTPEPVATPAPPASAQ